MLDFDYMKIFVTLMVSLVCILLLLKSRSSISASKKKKSRKSTVLFTGPSGAGKTSLFHKVIFGKVPNTVPGLSENIIRKVFDDNIAVQLVDFPGIPQLRNPLLRRCRESGAIIFVIDTLGSNSHFHAAAELLADLFTSHSVVDFETPILFALTRCGSGNGKSEAEIISVIESEMDRLKGSRDAVSRVGDDKESMNEKDQPLYLGTLEKPFTLAGDSPCPYRFTKVFSESTDPQDIVTDEVVSFIIENCQ